MNNIASIIKSPRFHAMTFEYNGKHYAFSGWWILDWIDGQKEYDSKEEFLLDPFFNEKNVVEIQNDIVDLDYELDP